MGLAIAALAFSRSGRPILEEVTGEFQPGEMVGVVGPNGSGKSTLLRLLYGYLRPDSGAVTLQGENIALISPRELARRLGACPQEPEPSLDFAVEQALALSSEGDLARSSERALGFPFLALDTLFGRRVSELSGGEKQRVRLGRTLLPRPAWLVLDEPANHLDLKTSWSLMLHLRRRAEEGEGGVVVALHDLAFATRFCHRLLVLDRGRLIALDTPERALSGENLRRVFGLTGAVSVGTTEDGGLPELSIRGVCE